MKIKEAFSKFFSSSEGKVAREMMARHDVPISQFSPTSLPDSYDNVKFNGVRVGPNGEFCRTVGEYKEAFNSCKLSK